MIKFLKPAVFYSLLCILSALSSLEAQIKPITEIREKLEQYCTSAPYEEAFVHTDREDYIAGEDIWFNVYLINKRSGKPSGRSKIAYLVLLNPENNPVIQKRLISENGFCPGQAQLPDTLSSGMYTLIVYTNQMKNWLPGNCFMKNINVYNPFRNKDFKRKIIYEKGFSRKQNIEFFPEGGKLLNDKPGKIALRVFDESGKGLLFTGVVTDNKGDSITSFKTDRYGTGAFELKPEKSKKYSVQVGDSIFFLPIVKDNGYAFKVNNLRSDSLIILISEAGNIASAKDNSNLRLIIHNHGIIDYSEYCRLTGQEAKIAIPKTKLIPGINHITLFDNEGNPLSERLIYLMDTERSGSKLPDRGSYKKREKVSLEFDLNKSQIASSGEVNLSLSVATRTVELRSPEIGDYLIFGTEFGPLPWSEGQEKVSDIQPGTIDNFLIGASSRWISWEKILSGQLARLEFGTEEDGHFLSGWMKNRNTQAPDSGRFLFLSIPGKAATFQYAKTDRAGHFSFLLPVDQSRRNLIIQPQTADDNAILDIESSFSWKLPLSTSYYEPVSTPFPREVRNLSINYQVGKIYRSSVKKTGPPEITQPQPVKRFYGKPEVELVIDDYIKLPVMEEVFFELVPGAKLRSRKSGYEMRIINPFTNLYYEQPPLVMIDGVSIHDLTLLANLDPETVERIDVVKTTYLLGDFKLYGIVNVITRKGNFTGLTLPDYAAKLTYRVIDPVVSFDSPDYSEPGMKQSRTPDLRNTLYWNPSLKPDKDGKVRIEFWTSDVASEYLIIIQGIDSSGKTVYINQLIKVE